MVSARTDFLPLKALGLWKLMKINQTRKGKAILSLLYSKGVSHHHLGFGRKSKAGRWVEKFYSGRKGSLQVCPRWRLLAWENWKQVDWSQVFHNGQVCVTLYQSLRKLRGQRKRLTYLVPYKETFNRDLLMEAMSVSWTTVRQDGGSLC